MLRRCFRGGWAGCYDPYAKPYEIIILGRIRESRGELLPVCLVQPCNLLYSPR